MNNTLIETKKKKKYLNSYKDHWVYMLVKFLIKTKIGFFLYVKCNIAKN